jgi:hypothetical protein
MKPIIGLILIKSTNFLNSEQSNAVFYLPGKVLVLLKENRKKNLFLTFEDIFYPKNMPRPLIKIGRGES